MTNEDNPKMNIDPEQLKKLEQAAREKGITTDQAIAEAIAAYLFKKQ